MAIGDAPVTKLKTTFKVLPKLAQIMRVDVQIDPHVDTLAENSIS